ncbi:MAG: flagellar motor switch protein FliM [Gammaproteobacteria bacterium]
MSDPAQILDANELDALMQAADTSGAPTARRSSPVIVEASEARAYDFSAPGRITHAYVPQLELINERFSRTFRPALFDLVHQYAELSKGEIAVYAFAEYMRKLQAPININMIRIRPLRGTAIVVIEPQLIDAIVDGFFGGKGRAATEQRMDFTPAETRTTRLLLDHALDALKQAWSYIQSLDFELLYSETNPQFASVMAESDSDVMVVTRFTVTIGDRSGEIHINLPYSMLEPLRARLTASIQSGDQEPDHVFKSGLKNSINEVEVDAHCELSPVTLSLEDLTRLRKGDVIPIPSAELATLYVGDVPVYAGRNGVHEGQRSMRVERSLHPAMQNLVPGHANG